MLPVPSASIPAAIVVGCSVLAAAVTFHGLTTRHMVVHVGGFTYVVLDRSSGDTRVCAAFGDGTTEAMTLWRRCWRDGGLDSASAAPVAIPLEPVE